MGPILGSIRSAVDSEQTMAEKFERWKAANCLHVGIGNEQVYNVPVSSLSILDCNYFRFLHFGPENKYMCSQSNLRLCFYALV